MTPSDLSALDDRIELYIRRTVPVIVKEMQLVHEDTCSTAKRVRRFGWCLVGMAIGISVVNIPAGILVLSKIL